MELSGHFAGVLGLPNVGKSSLINSLKRARVAQTGNTPGVTKSVQQVDTSHIVLSGPAPSYLSLDLRMY